MYMALTFSCELNKSNFKKSKKLILGPGVLQYTIFKYKDVGFGSKVKTYILCQF